MAGKFLGSSHLNYIQMKTETFAVHHHPVVFPGNKAATNMPFFDGTTLAFGLSPTPVEKTIRSTGSIWKTMRHNRAMAERFKDIPRSYKILYQPWKLAYCNWEDKIIHPISTGLPNQIAERSPSFYREGDQVHLSFIAGVPSEQDISYRLYSSSGPDLGHMSPAKPLAAPRIFLGFASPTHIGWGAQNVLRLTEKSSGKIFKLKFDFFRLTSATFLADQPSRLLITGLNKERDYHTILHDLADGSTSDVSVDGPVYKSSLYGDRLIFTQKRDGFENRELCYGNYTLSPSTIQISREG